MSDETLYIYNRNTDYKLPPFGRYQKVARPDALALFTDSELIGELVRRGAGKFDKELRLPYAAERKIRRRFIGAWSEWEPVGSVEESS